MIRIIHLSLCLTVILLASLSFAFSQSSMDSTQVYTSAIQYIYANQDFLKRKWNELADKSTKLNKVQLENTKFVIADYISHQNFFPFNRLNLDSSVKRIDAEYFETYKHNFYVNDSLHYKIDSTTDDKNFLFVCFSRPVQNNLLTVVTRNSRALFGKMRMLARCLSILFVYDDLNKINKVYYSFLYWD
jgi:hypothetical protein